MAGGAFWTAAYPLNSLKGVMQAEPSTEEEKQVLLKCGKKLIKKAGMKSLFDGYSSGIVKPMPSFGLCYLMFEVVRSNMDTILPEETVRRNPDR